MADRRSSFTGIALLSVLLTTTYVNAFDAVGKSVSTLGSVEEAPNATDETAIHALHQRMIDSWNRGNGASFAEIFTDDADLAVVGGKRLKGRQEIAATYQRLFDGGMRGSRFTSQMESLRFLSSNIALFSAVTGTLMPGDRTDQAQRDFLQTMVAVKRDGRWRIAAFHDSRILNIEQQRPSADYEMPADRARRAS